ncbi:MAG: hypothetical protein AB8G26_12675 [Ilumatobacter sp.]
MAGRTAGVARCTGASPVDATAAIGAELDAELDVASPCSCPATGIDLE